MAAFVLPVLERRHDWAIRLTEFLSESRREGVELDWEFFNCVSWPADAVEAMTGVDLYAEYRGKSNSALSAWRLMKLHGFASMEEVLTSKLEEKPIAMTHRGDICLVPIQHNPQFIASLTDDQNQDPTDAVAGMNMATCVADPPVVWTITETGIIAIRMDQVCKSFKVGF